MPAPVHARLRIGGTLYGDAQWSVGINFGSGQGTDPFANFTSDVNDALDQWTAAVRALNGRNIVPTAMMKGLSRNGSIDYIRGSRVGLDGKETNVSLINLGEPVKGTTDSYGPAQVAAAISLTTGRPGASYRGRIYWPGIGYNLNLGRMAGTMNAELAADAAQWLRDLQDAADLFQGVGGVLPVVVSTSRSALTRVTGTRVGNRLDSQRRRAESEKEVYGVASVPQ